MHIPGPITDTDIIGKKCNDIERGRQTRGTDTLNKYIFVAHLVLAQREFPRGVLKPSVVEPLF